MRTYTGVITSASENTVTVKLDCGTSVPLHASGQVAAEARAMIGRRVRFQADLSEKTETLTAVQLCVRSSYGLRAVAVSTGHLDVRVTPQAEVA